MTWGMSFSAKCTFYPIQAVTAVDDHHAKEPKYWIGNIEGRVNGWCFREHIYGILVEVQTEWEGRYYSRPLPKSVYEEVRAMIQDYRWSRSALRLCEPTWDTPQ